MMETATFWVMWVALGGMMFLYYLRRFHTVRSMVCGILSGWSVLLLLHYVGGWIGFAPELSGFNLVQAGILGIPGVVMMTILHYVL